MVLGNPRCPLMEDAAQVCVCELARLARREGRDSPAYRALRVATMHNGKVLVFLTQTGIFVFAIPPGGIPQA